MTIHDLEHDRLQESAGLYVLDALAETERVEFERHLRSCAECTAEVRSLRAVVGTLAHAMPVLDPPASLRNRVLAVAGTPSSTESVVVPMPSPVKARTSAWSSGWLTAAALLLVSIGLTGYAVSLRQLVGGLRAEITDLSARLDRSEQQLNVATRSVAVAEARMAVLTAPDLTQVNLQGQEVAPRATGRAFWSRSRGLVFTASDLPPLPAGRTYQLWIVTALAPVSAGLLQPDSIGRVAQAFDTPAAGPSEAVAIAVTQEPEGGVPAPTGDRYLVGTTQ